MPTTVIFGQFEWDPEKADENVRKHNLDFHTASLVFLDPKRVIAIDEKHSSSEERLYCVGQIGKRVATVRFTMRKKRIRIIGAGFWRAGGKYMKRKQKDNNEPVGMLKPIPDFLPPPEQLLPNEETIKITVALDAKTLKFFKSYATKSGQKYQRLIREVLKGYARRYG